MHDHYRQDCGGKPTHSKVMRGIEILHAHNVEFNTLTVVHRRNSSKPLEVYRFLRRIGSGLFNLFQLLNEPLPVILPERIPVIATLLGRGT